MLRRFIAVPLAGTLLAACAVPAFAAGDYGLAGRQAADWLISRQDASDGSWGNAPGLKPVHTALAVRALHAMNRRDAAYYAGIAWLKNHETGNIDYRARRMVALAESGAVVSNDLQALLSEQRPGAPFNRGWGLTAAYNGSPLDTALALQAIGVSGQTVDTSAAISYLKGAQLTGTDKGWSISQNTASDATTNAMVILALVPYRAQDNTLATPLANAAATLAAQVGAGAPVQMRALAAQALLARDPASSSGIALLNGVLAQQGSDGAWGGDIHATASALQALAVAAGSDLAAQRLRVEVPDEALRAAINKALNRGALDHLNRGELAKLTSLDISGSGVTSLAGLEYATNLTALHAANNSITDTSPLNGLTQLATTDLAGNPCAGCSAGGTSMPMGETPLPAWALAALGAAFVGAMRRSRNRRGS